jgi:hypothetical protein
VFFEVEILRSPRFGWVARLCLFGGARGVSDRHRRNLSPGPTCGARSLLCESHDGWGSTACCTPSNRCALGRESSKSTLAWSWSVRGRGVVLRRVICQWKIGNAESLATGSQCFNVGDSPDAGGAFSRLRPGRHAVTGRGLACGGARAAASVAACSGSHVGVCGPVGLPTR